MSFEGTNSFEHEHEEPLHTNYMRPLTFAIFLVGVPLCYYGPDLFQVPTDYIHYQY